MDSKVINESDHLIKKTINFSMAERQKLEDLIFEMATASTLRKSGLVKTFKTSNNTSNREEKPYKVIEPPYRTLCRLKQHCRDIK